MNSLPKRVEVGLLFAAASGCVYGAASCTEGGCGNACCVTDWVAVGAAAAPAVRFRRARSGVRSHGRCGLPGHPALILQLHDGVDVLLPPVAVVPHHSSSEL